MENCVDRSLRTCHVTHLANGLSEQLLYDVFEKAGPIEKLIMKFGADGLTVHCIVQFKYAESARWAIDHLNGLPLGGQSILVMPPLPRATGKACFDAASSSTGGGRSHKNRNRNQTPDLTDLRTGRGHRQGQRHLPQAQTAVSAPVYQTQHNNHPGHSHIGYGYSHLTPGGMSAQLQYPKQMPLNADWSVPLNWQQQQQMVYGQQPPQLSFVDWLKSQTEHQ